MVSPPAGQNVAVMDIICKANFGDLVYVRSPDNGICMRVNTTCSAQPGNTIEFTGLEKSGDSAVVTVTGSGYLRVSGSTLT